MKKVLVLWDEIPESVSFVEVECEGEELARLLSFHQEWINNSELSDEIYSFFYDEYNDFRFTRHNGPMSGHYDHIIITGFIV